MLNRKRTLSNTHLVIVNLCLMFLLLSGLSANGAPDAQQPMARVLHVNNLVGNDQFDGATAKPAADGKRGPLGSIRQAFATARTSDRIEIANTGKPYAGGNRLTRCGGTAERPLVINGNGALISGLGEVPKEKWHRIEDGIFATAFWPGSNQLKQRNDITCWIDSPQIWWIDGTPGVNCKSVDELKSKEGGFYWNKAQKEVWIHLPDSNPIEKAKIEMPIDDIAIEINMDFVTVQDLRSIFSLDDGFNSHAGKNIVFQRCVATDNCDQGFSCHGWSSVLYEDCLAERCAGSGSCDVHQCDVTYRRCVFVNNTFEAGVYVTDNTAHSYEDCLIVGNKPFEQIWAKGKGKMNFRNCVIAGDKGSNHGIMLMENGAVLFEQCTFADAAFLCKIDDAQFGQLSMRNCILTRFSDVFLTVSENAKRRVSLENNVYSAGPGMQFGKKIFAADDWKEYQTVSGLDKESAWLDPRLSGKLNVELPKDSPLHHAGKLFGRPTRLGALLPSSVWELYEKTRGDYASPEGVKSRK